MTVITEHVSPLTMVTGANRDGDSQWEPKTTMKMKFGIPTLPFLFENVQIMCYTCNGSTFGAPLPSITQSPLFQENKQQGNHL